MLAAVLAVSIARFSHHDDGLFLTALFFFSADVDGLGSLVVLACLCPAAALWYYY